MDPVEQQFKTIGSRWQIEQSQQLSVQEVAEAEEEEEETQDTESSSTESEGSGDYTIMFPDEQRPGRFEPKFFDREGFTILNMTASRLEKKCKPKTRKKKKPKRQQGQYREPEHEQVPHVPRRSEQERWQHVQNLQARHQQARQEQEMHQHARVQAQGRRIDLVGVSRPSVVQQKMAKKQDIVVEIPMKLDLFRPPPPSEIIDVNKNFKKWLDTLTAKFGHLHPEGPDSATSQSAAAVAPEQPQVADVSGHTTSAPTLTTKTASTSKQYSQKQHPQAETATTVERYLFIETVKIKMFGIIQTALSKIWTVDKQRSFEIFVEEHMILP